MAFSLLLKIPQAWWKIREEEGASRGCVAAPGTQSFPAGQLASSCPHTLFFDLGQAGAVGYILQFDSQFLPAVAVSMCHTLCPDKAT